MLVDELPHLLPGARDAERVVLVPILDLGQQVAESLGRNLVRVRRRIRQDDVHALKELLQVDLEVGPLLQVFHALDGLLQDLVGSLRVGDLLLHPRPRSRPRPGP